MRIRVIAGSRQDAVCVRDGVLTVKVSAPAQDGKANRRVAEVLEKRFGCKATIISGLRSKDKEVAFARDERFIQEKVLEISKQGGI